MLSRACCHRYKETYANLLWLIDEISLIVILSIVSGFILYTGWQLTKYRNDYRIRGRSEVFLVLLFERP